MIDAKKNRRILILLGVVLLLVAMFSLFIGPQGWSAAILGQKTAGKLAIFNYRLSRIVLAIIAGSSLAASGASLQSIFRNPLADPHIFGISGGAALGAALVIALEINVWLAPSLGAILGGLAAFVLIFYYINHTHDQSLSQCLLVGILINSIAAALISLIKILTDPNKTHSLLYWLMGHIDTVDSKFFLIIIPLWLLGLSIIFYIKNELEILSFGQIEARILGINTNIIIKLAVLANCILIGNVVAFAGMVGFIGLVIPHVIRLRLDPDLGFVLPAASLLGAIVLLLFDSLSRLSFLWLETEIPVGALSALFLSPVLFFIILISNHESSYDY